jgi:hypothetical protein
MVNESQSRGREIYTTGAPNRNYNSLRLTRQMTFSANYPYIPKPCERDIYFLTPDELAAKLIIPILSNPLGEGRVSRCVNLLTKTGLDKKLGLDNEEEKRRYVNGTLGLLGVEALSQITGIERPVRHRAHRFIY